MSSNNISASKLCFVAVSYEKGKHLLRISYEVRSIAYTKVNRTNFVIAADYDIKNDALKTK